MDSQISILTTHQYFYVFPSCLFLCTCCYGCHAKLGPFTFRPISQAPEYPGTEVLLPISIPLPGWLPSSSISLALSSIKESSPFLFSLRYTFIMEKKTNPACFCQCRSFILTFKKLVVYRVVSGRRG